MLGARDDRVPRGPRRGRSITPDRGRRRPTSPRASRGRSPRSRRALREPVLQRRQPRRAARHHRRARHGARLPAARGTRTARPAVQRLQRPGLPHRRPARHAARARAGRRLPVVESIRRACGRVDKPVILGDPSRTAAETGWRPAIPIERHARGPARTTGDCASPPTRDRAWPRRQHDERSRQIVHIAMGGFALLLRYLTWWQAAHLAAAALAFNLFVLPALRRHALPAGRTSAQRSRRASSSIRSSVLLLIVVVPAPARHRRGRLGHPRRRRRHGDARRPAVGERSACPWNREKSVAGSCAFVRLRRRGRRRPRAGGAGRT